MKGRIKRTPGQSSGVVLPRIGFIKVGKKVMGGNGKEYPTSTDYFIPSGKYASLFTQVYGEKPQTIQIVFPANDAESVCKEQWEYRTNDGKLVAYGDGEIFNVWDGRNYEPVSIIDFPRLMDGVKKKYPSKRGWAVTLTLTFILPMVRGIAGVWQFTTKGDASSIPNIRNTFDAMIEQRGAVAGVLFDMNVQFAKSQKPGENSRYPVVSIVPNESADNIARVREARRPIMIEDKPND